MTDIGARTSATPVADRFEGWVASAGQAPALVTGGETVSYRELSRRSRRIARAVLDSPGDRSRPIAIMAKRPVEVIPAMLGVLGAGRTYVILDPEQPADRLEYTLAHSTADLVITTDPIRENPPLNDEQLEWLSIDSLPEPTSDLAPAKDAQPAYILYTSGSTGRPKGVIQSQAHLTNKADMLAETLDIGPHDRLSLLFSPTAGASTSDIYGALLNGATVVPFDLPGGGLQGLADWLDEARITVVHTLPTIFRRLLETVDPGRVFETVRMLALSGESVLQSDLDLFRTHFGPRTRLVHRLSSTETGGVAFLAIDQSTEITDEILPVGYAHSGRTVRLLDDTGKEVGIGEKGEIAVESEFLALGYWRDEELTDRAFIPTPEGGRQYLTGDIARRRADGCIEFLGRRAGRLKIAGHTIETREVELALQAVGRFKELAVVGREAIPGQPEMAAFYVPAEGAPSWDAGQRAKLADRVPQHMIPSRFIELGTLPLTPLGKIDRGALPWPSPANGPEPKGLVAPRDELEAALAEIWQTVFGHQVGVNDDFFDLGGTSIQSFSIFALLARRRGIDLPPTTIAQAPTIERLARLIEAEPGRGRVSTRWEHLVALRPEGEKPPLFCLHGGEGYTLSFRKLTEHLDAGRPLYGLDAPALDGHRLPLRTVDSIAASYLAEIRAVQPRGPYHLAGFSFGGTVGFEIAHQLVEADEEVALLCLLDAVRSEVSLGEARRRHRRRFLRSIWMGLRRTASRVAGADIDVAGRSTGRLLREVPIQLLVDLVPRRLLRWYCDRRLAGGRPVQHALRQPYYVDVHSEASHAYRLRPYDGRLAIIAAQGEVEARRSEWEPFATRGAEISELDCGHLEMFLEPHVAQLADQVQGLLDRAE